jgi:uncharacterized membrane protein YedE/YeeE
MKLFVSFVVGLIFSLGLGVSGMTQPQKVIGFLDLFGEWNPALAFVMIGAIGLHAILFPIITKRKSPILVDQFHLPNKSDLDGRLIVGALLFGMGWGLGGFCPGPGIVSLASGNSSSFVFVSSMVGGMLVFHFLKPVLNKIFS